MESVSPPKERLVLDCSVALCWYFRDEADPYADGVATRLTSTEAVVPSLWPLEVANAVLMGERRNRSTQADAQRWIAVLETLPITLDGETAARAWNDTLKLARAQNLSAYDAAYLELRSVGACRSRPSTPNSRPRPRLSACPSSWWRLERRAEAAPARPLARRARARDPGDHRHRRRGRRHPLRRVLHREHPEREHPPRLLPERHLLPPLVRGARHRPTSSS